MLSHESDNEYAMLDSTIVRVHQHSAEKKKNRRSDAVKFVYHRIVSGNRVCSVSLVARTINA